MATGNTLPPAPLIPSKPEDVDMLILNRFLDTLRDKIEELEKRIEELEAP